MTPEERKQFNDMKRRLEQLEQVQNVSFIENMKRRLFPITLNDLPSIKLSNLSDVGGTDSPTNGQVLKYDGTTDNRWEPGTDNTA